MERRSIVDLACANVADPAHALRLEDECRGRIAEYEPHVHAFITIVDEQARLAPVRETNSGRLRGIPIAVKDNICTRGIRTTAGSRALETYVPPYDATAVELLEAAGAVIVGKTNLDEFAMGSSTEFSFFGPTHNPHKLDRVPGGSSGGSAAAVAAGFVVAALGSDTGGSVRQPAAHCGVVGVKPTYGAVSRYGLIAYASSLDQIGVITRSVLDAAVVTEVISGHDSRDSTSAQRAMPNLVAACEREAPGLRVGVVREMLAEGVEPAVRRAVFDAAESLRSAGAAVTEVNLRSLDHALSSYYLIAMAEASSNLARYDGLRYGVRSDRTTATEMMTATRTESFGEEVKRRIVLGTFVLSAGYHDKYYAKAQRVRTLVIRDFKEAFSKVDVLLGPTSPRTAFPIGELIDDPVELYLTDICTVAANLAGSPASSVPWGCDNDGLPIGVQVVAAPFREDALFTASAALERLAPAIQSPTLE